jgi:hypothetical protein
MSIDNAFSFIRAIGVFDDDTPGGPIEIQRPD